MGRGPSQSLHSEKDKESDHQTEESQGLRQGKAQNSIGGEELLLERWVSGIAKDKATKHYSKAPEPVSPTVVAPAPVGHCVNGDHSDLELQSGHLE